MSTYVMSDIHGQYEMFMKMLEEINFSETDTLYVLGDVLDRGPNPIKCLLKMMEMPNVIPIAGNHELMGLPCLSFLMKDITTDTFSLLDDEMIERIVLWKQNGSQTTIDEFDRLNATTKEQVVKYIEDFQPYEELKINGKEYILVHAGLGNFKSDKSLEEYTIEELVWERVDYSKPYFEDVYVLSGHTPTQVIKNNERPGYIYRKNNHIAIDCGAGYSRGRLAAICLETEQEFYVEC